MAKSMQHWNGEQCVVIDTETTGRNPEKHEMIQVAMVALDHNFDPRTDVSPFIVLLKPDYPENAEPEAMRINGLKLEDLMIHGLERDMAIGMFERWFDSLGLPYTEWGNQKKIIPLGQNYKFDESFIRKWLGHEHYEHCFSYAVRDTKAAALYLNDNAAMHGDPPVFNKVDLASLGNAFGIKNERAHDAYHDCVTTAKIYKRMCQRGVLV